MATYAPLSPPIQGMPIGGQRREVHTMPGYSDEWDLLQEALETTGMFPFAPGLGDFSSELGDLILYSSSGKGRTGIDRVNDLDRYAALPATWIGQATQEFGGLLQMTPEQLVQLRRSIGSILSDDNNARSALWEGVKEAGRGYQEDPMSAAEDFGSPGMIGIAAPRLLTGMAKKALKGEDMPVKQPGVDIQQGIGAFAPKTPSKMMPPEVTGQQLQAYHMPETVGWDVDNIPADQWNKFVNTGDADAIKVEGDLPDPDDVDFGMAQTEATAPSKPSDPKFVPLDDNKIAALSDDALDIEINKSNTTINSMTGSDYVDEEYEDTLRDFKDELDKLVAERSRRRAGGDESPSGETPWAEDNKDLIVGTPTSEDIDLFSRTSQSASAGSNQDIQNAIDKVREHLSSASAGDDISDRLITMLNIYIKERAKRLSAGSWDVDFGGNKF